MNEIHDKQEEQGARTGSENERSAPRPPATAEEESNQLPRINLGALFMPAVWGPAHGQWVTILFYPLWLFADSCITNAVLYGGFTIVMAATVILGTAAVTLLYACTAGQKAYERASRTMTMQQYRARQRKWAVACFFIALFFVGLATWYNLTIRLVQG